MHDHGKDGNEYFKCDFCCRAWAEDLPMVEGHRGSLICGECLTMAFSAVNGAGAQVMGDQGSCALCLQYKSTAAYESPTVPGCWACQECITRSAVLMERDNEVGWTRPQVTSGDQPTTA